MPVLHQLQPSFNNGEISPLLYDRVDYNKFTSSVKSGKNMFVHPQGGMSNRAGTKMLGKAKTADSSVVEENVMLFCWNISGYPLYYTESATPKEGDVVYKDLETTPSCEVVSVDLTASPNAIVIKDGVYNRNSVRYSGFDTERVVTKTKNLTKKVRLIPFEFSNTETYMIEFGDFYCRFYTTNGQVVTEEGLPYEIESPFSVNDLYKIRYCQSADVMYLAWGGNPQTLTRYGHTNWQFKNYNYTNGPFEIENTDKTKKVSVRYVVDDLDYKITSDFDVFTPESIGRLFYVEKDFNAGHLSGAMSTGNYQSGNSLCSGNYVFKTTGTWSGTIKIEYSRDLSSWQDEKSFSSANDFNVDFSGVLLEGIWWVRITAKIDSGTCNYLFDSESFRERCVFQIKSFVSEREVRAIYSGDIAGFQGVFPSNSSGDIVDIIPPMTSNKTPYGEAYSADRPDDAYLLFLGKIGVYETIGSLDPENPASSTRLLFWSFGTEETQTFGYKFQEGKSFYVQKISFYVAEREHYGENKPLNNNWYSESFDFKDYFSGFSVYYSLGGGPKVQVFANPIIKENRINVQKNSKDLAYVEISFQTPFLADNIFFSVTTPPAYYAQHYGSILSNIKASGIEYNAESSTGVATSSFSFGKWFEKGLNPTEVDLYQDRIVWATNNQLDATKISDYTNFDVSDEVTADDAISVIIKDKKINKINSAIAGSQLVVFTDSGNFIHNNDTFTPSSATFLNQGSTGGANVKPVIVRDNIIYVHPMKQAISDYAYSFETDGYAGQDITILANHLFDNKKIKELAYQQEPYSIIWVLQEEGTMLACTYLRQQNVIAWTPMDFGGKVLSIGVMSNGSNQELYLAVERKNGVFIEKMPYRMLDNDPKERFFVDCGSTYRGEPANIIAGLEYLEGESVVALADGYVVKDLVVENGQITLPTPASIVTVGLPYESVLETLTFDVSQGDGSNLNRKKRVVAVSVRYNNSRGSRISVNGHREVPMLERKIDNKDTDISLKSGFYREILPSAHNEPTTIKIRQDEPLPLTIVSIIPELEYER